MFLRYVATGCLAQLRAVLPISVFLLFFQGIVFGLELPWFELLSLSGGILAVAVRSIAV